MPAASRRRSVHEVLAPFCTVSGADVFGGGSVSETIPAPPADSPDKSSEETAAHSVKSFRTDHALDSVSDASDSNSARESDSRADMIRLARRMFVAACSLTALSCSSDNAPANSVDGGTATPSEYRATVRWTGYGIPHIRAADLPSAAYASAYVASRDDVCILADQFIRLRSERAKYLGPGEENVNLDSDFAWLLVGIRATAERTYAELDRESRALVVAYATGYNRYLEETSASDRPAACREAEWVKPIEPVDLWTYYAWLALARGTDLIAQYLGTAAPPETAAVQRPRASQFAKLPFAPRTDSLGSNGWAIGRDRSANGHGMILATPHLPWQGPRRLREQHITVPGVMNVYGASLVGVPLVLIGFNEHVGWTHSASTAANVTAYRLQLVPGKPTHYVFDGREVEMTARDYVVDVQQPDGSVAVVHRTLYRSHYGPMIASEAMLGWNEVEAYTLRDANEGNVDLLRTYLGMNRARSLAEFEDAQEKARGLPWVNTMAASASGTALFVASARTAALSPAAEQAYLSSLGTDIIARLVRSNGLIVLDGSSSLFDWQDRDPRVPGIFAYRDAPRLERTDFVFNSNDSHWLTNPAAPLTGYSAMFGEEATQRTTRTRLNLTLLTETGEGTASGADGKFSLDELAAVPFNNRALVGELLRDGIVARCKAAGSVEVGSETIDLTAACAALEAWDLRVDTGSAGAPLWREFLSEFTASFNFVTMGDLGLLFSEPFDANDPIGTPRGLLNPLLSEDSIPLALGSAVQRLRSLGLREAVTLGEVQFTTRGDERLPIHGGLNTEGAFNIVGYDANDGTRLPGVERGLILSTNGLTPEGYPVNTGTGFMLAMSFTDDGPEARALLAYSQSPDPRSPHNADQMQLYARKAWRTVAFHERDIAADPELRTERIRAARAD